jgi:hypothetical protein
MLVDIATPEGLGLEHGPHRIVDLESFDPAPSGGRVRGLR